MGRAGESLVVLLDELDAVGRAGISQLRGSERLSSGVGEV